MPAADTKKNRPPLLPDHAALYLDFDGTLAHLAPHPDAVVIPAGLPELLIALRARLDGALAVITGRALNSVDQLLRPLVLQGAGQHGAELRAEEGITPQVSRPLSLSRLAAELAKRYPATEGGVWFEDKGAAIALHYRQAPERAEECLETLHALVGDADLEVLRGSMVVEVRPRGVHKGRALEALTGRSPFAGRVPVFIGDDVTDEDGFEFVTGRGGFGVKVGAGETLARYRCADVDCVHDWLRASLAALQ